MKQIVLSIEQMNFLKKLGVDTSGASACHYKIFYSLSFGSNEYEEWNIDLMDEYKDPCNFQRIPDLDGQNNADVTEIIPAFTLQDILELLPKYIYPFPTEKIVFSWTMECDTIAYRNTEVADDCLKNFTGENLLEVSYEMLCWCAKNGYLTTNRK